MKINECGEFGFIDLIKENTIADPDSVVFGIGDDCAVYKAGPHTDQVITTDMMVEDIHFSARTTEPFHVGYRLGAANISDIAAMGASPKQAVISIALPDTFDTEYGEKLFRGIKQIFQEFKVNLLGGDTVKTKGPLIVNLTVVGEVPSGQAVYRSGAQPGDVVFVTNNVGSAAAGLYALLHDMKGYETIKKAHQMPVPQVQLGTALRINGVHALNDISDGVSSELNEIANASAVDIYVDESKLPLDKELLQLSQEASVDPYQFAWQGGEDFQLIGTMSRAQYEEFSQKESLTVIGHVAQRDNLNEDGNKLKGRLFVTDVRGNTQLVQVKGYNHFK